ncbi:MAG: ATP-binding protein [Coriobacteriia bacterium]|nr:ATP-binding protein [Coriobacteriia bacterium]
MYIEREIEGTITELLAQFKVVLITGPRQVGKTTMLQHVLSSTHAYVTLDNILALKTALDDPPLFFLENPPPLIIDEVQYAQDIFRQIKLIVDQSDARGSIVLTGSQPYHLMQHISDSLAGRIAILEMSGLSQRELTGHITRKPFIPHESMLQKNSRLKDAHQLWARIHRGSMPELQNETIDWATYYQGYVRSYIERDVRELIRLKDEIKFYNFLVAMAARTGQIFNAASIANDLDISLKTVQSWASILEASSIMRFVRPYHENINKQLIKAPKPYFYDTGLVCHLLGWNSPEVLQSGAMAGQLFETFAVSEILKSHQNAGEDFRNIFFYRDTEKREIDLVIRSGRSLHPIEIKKTANPRREMTSSFKALDAFSLDIGIGALVCMTNKSNLLAQDVLALPIDLI